MEDANVEISNGMSFTYVDIHSHLFFKDYDQDLEDVLTRMKEDGVSTITVGTELKTSKEAVAFARGREGFYASLGLHPNHAGEETFSESDYAELAADPNVVAIGECGIDYYRLQSAGGSRQVEEKKNQYREFEKQMEFAIEYDKPMMIHARPTKGSMDAYLDIAAIIESRQKLAGEKLRGNMHFFVGSIDVAKKFYSLGFTTSFTGVLTFTHDYDEVVKYAPLDMIMTETDAPFASPAPFRGRRNEPSYVKYVVEAIARIRDSNVEDIRESVVKNATRVFNLQG